MKAITMYLPQFHRVKENDEWWGEGFTEWVAVKAAKPLYEGHYQPREPLNNNYYDLMEKSTLLQQADLMKKYGIYGMCFYHYWFKDSKQILEKPVENLLKWTDIDMPFCLSWANESWIRTWSTLSNANVWADKFDRKMDTNEINGVLLEQKYGDKESWYLHFKYLLPFFQDERYIKIDGKPVFIFYKPNSIYCLPQMMDYWESLAKENGLKGIYFIGTNVDNGMGLDAVLQQEPAYTLESSKFQNIRSDCWKIVDYQMVWDMIVNRPINMNNKVFLGAFVEFDNTPRMGKGGVVTDGATPLLFEKNLKKILKKSQLRGNEYIFINAWNEWGEGMYLEPDKKNGYGYLEAVKNALDSYNEENICIAEDQNDIQVQFHKEIEFRYESYWKTLDKWLTFKENGKKVEDFLLKRGFRTVAIYGLSMLGNHLISELENSNIEIGYGIDNRKGSIRKKFPIYCIEDDLPEVDAVIVSVTHQFIPIYYNLKRKLECSIISLNELLEED